MTNKASKPVAKSLHTITVIVQVARLWQSHALTLGKPTDAANAVALAMDSLGLSGRADPYGLAAIALKQLGA